MVVAGADVGIAAQTARFLPHNQRSLGVRLEPRYAESDVGADALQFGRPVQVALFVEAGLDLHHAGDLLAMLCGPDQRFDKRRIVANPVSGHLDGDGLRIIGSSTDEVFHARVEAVIGMMDQHVTSLDRGEDCRPILESGGC